MISKVFLQNFFFAKSKWLFLGTYHPPSQLDQYFYENLDNAAHIDSNYGKFLLSRDFNALL